MDQTTLTKYQLIGVDLAAHGDFGEVDLVLTLNEKGKPFTLFAFNGMICSAPTEKKQEAALVDYLHNYIIHQNLITGEPQRYKDDSRTGLAARLAKAEAENVRLKRYRSEDATTYAFFKKEHEALKSRLAEAVRLLRIAQKEFCSMKCPSTWKVGVVGCSPHCEECQQMTRFLAENGGDVK